MAYSPLEQGRLLGHGVLNSVAEAHGATSLQVALACVLRHDDVIAIPKASTVAHVEDNHAALGISLTDEDLKALDAAFPAPVRKEPLEISVPGVRETASCAFPGPSRPGSSRPSLSRGGYLMARGLIGEPTARVNFSGDPA